MDTEAFRDFERAAHDRVADGYHDFFEPVTGGAGLVDVAAREVTWVHPVPNAEAWWRGGLGSLARASASILGQAPAMQRRIRAAFDRLVVPYAAEGGFRVPCAARVASGRKP